MSTTTLRKIALVVEEDIEFLARRGDMTKEAVAFRLRSARISLDLAQNQIAESIGTTAPAWNNWERARAYPSLQAMRYLFRRHRIDFNFILHGDVAQLPNDVQLALLEAMRA